MPLSLPATARRVDGATSTGGVVGAHAASRIVRGTSADSALMKLSTLDRAGGNPSANIG